MFIKKSPDLACFSPPVMMATCVIELALAVWIAVKYPSSLFRTIVGTLILCLASFQLAEYQVCLGPEAYKLAWTKFGLVGITLLPALGMHLNAVVTKMSFFVPIGYVIAAAYAIVFLMLPASTVQAECCGNYVMMHINGGWIGLVYEVYYSVFVLMAIMDLALRLVGRGAASDSGYSRKLVGLTLAAFLSFTVPMAIVAIVSTQLRQATPSIMCGFAVFLALILASFVAPQYAKETALLGVVEPSATPA